MKVLFLGYAISMEEANKITGASVAGNKMQLSILEYMNNAIDELYSVTVYPLASFPQAKKIYVGKEELLISEKLKSLRVPYWNIPILKQVSQIISIYRFARRYVKNNQDAVIVTWNMYPQVGIPAVWLQKKYGASIIPILADLPIDDNYQRTGLSSWLRRIFDDSTVKNIKKADKVIALNKHAVAKFAQGIEYLIIEGGVEPKDYQEQERDKKGLISEKRIIYGGSLAEYSGIKELVDAMRYVQDDNISLCIYGDGYWKEYVKECKQKNVNYCGMVSNAEMLNMQKEAWLLVNPRPIDDKIAQVTFPSKIFEYLMSGTPVLSTRLNGFTEEYFDKMFWVEKNTPQELAKAINEISDFSEDELELLANKARYFILEEKNWKAQCDKIIAFLKKK